MLCWKNFWQKYRKIFSKINQNANFFCLKSIKNHVKPPPKPHGVSVKIPHPRGFSKSIPHPHGGWGWGPHGAPVGFGDGGKTLHKSEK